MSLAMPLLEIIEKDLTGSLPLTVRGMVWRKQNYSRSACKLEDQVGPTARTDLN